MKKRFLAAGCVVAVGVAVAIHAQTSPAPQSAAAAQRALLDQYCVGCHNSNAKPTPPGNLALDKMDVNQIAQNAEVWEGVVRKLRAGMMPPSPSKRPDKATMNGMIAWFEGELDRNAQPYMPPPGLHRLNGVEYANAIRDLLDLKIDAAQYLPTDNATKGFDSIASALTLSSTLIEAYVSAAGKISRLAIGEPTTPSLKVYRTAEDASQDYQIEGLPFGTRGGMLIEHIFPSDGEYTITVTPIFGDNMSPQGFGTMPCQKLEFLLDGERLRVMDWQGGGRGGGGGATCPATPDTTRRGTPANNDPVAVVLQDTGGGGGGGGNTRGGGGGGGGGMRVRIRTKAGLHKIGVTFLANNFAPNLDMERHHLRSTLQTGPTPGYTFYPHVGTVRVEGPFNATAAVDSPSRRKIFICRPASAAEEEGCARKIVSNLAEKAFRHTATAEDIDPLVDYYRASRKEGAFDQAIGMTLARILASPKFVYRVEAQPAAQTAEAFRLSDTELASRLSYFLWSAAPDTELLTLANQGKLKDAATLEAQVARMLKDPRSKALTDNFAGQWLNLRGMAAAGVVPMIYPDFDDPLRQSMRREVELLFDSIIQENRSIVDLLTADYTFVDERLAKHYGIPNVYGSNFRRVKLDGPLDVRRGLLGKGAILVTTSKPERTSPVTRGKWVIANLLGIQPPPPPPDVPALPPRANDVRGNAKEPTMREKMMGHRIATACVQCHKIMDPIGFTLENFDGIGLWRTTDVGSPIDAADTLFDGTKVDGPAALRQWLVGYSDQYVEVVTEKLLTYALGRGAEYKDMPTIRAIAHGAARDNNRFSSIVLGIVKSAPFQMNARVPQTGNN